MLKKIHRVARITALLAIPVLAVIVPQQVGKRIGDREIELEYIKVAVGIQNNSLSPSSLKEWSTQILVYFSPVEISEPRVMILDFGVDHLQKKNQIHSFRLRKDDWQLQKRKPQT